MNSEARCLLYRPHMPTLRQEFCRVTESRQRVSKPAGEESASEPAGSEPASETVSQPAFEYESTVQDSTGISVVRESQQKAQ
jgi:hypothetical protein